MPPIKKKKGESKQSFMRRCVAEERNNGTADSKAMSTCAGQWKVEMSDADNDMIRLFSAGPADIKASEGDGQGADDKPRRFGMLAYTGKVIDLRWWRLVIDLKGISCKAEFPALREHERGRIVGTCDEWKTDANGLHVMGRFSKVTADAAEVLGLADEDFPWQTSVGIWAVETDFLEAGKSRKVNGMVVDGPCEIWTKSDVRECSFVSLGADDDTAAIVMSDEAGNHTEDPMNKNLRAMLVRMGMPTDATDEAAQAFLHAMGERGRTLAASFENEPETTPNGDGSAPGAQLSAPGGGPAPTPAPVAPAAPAVQADLAAERQRTTDIHHLCRKLGLPATLGDQHVQAGTSLAAFRELALNQALAANPRVGGFEHGADESDKFRNLAAEGMLLRAGGKVEKQQAGSREFRNMRIIDLATKCLTRAGVSVQGLSATQIGDLILKPSLRMSASVSDFPAIFMDVANKRLQKAYEEAGSTWEQWCSIVDAADFKDINGVALSEAPDLELVGEHGEYKTGALKDKQERYAVRKYGKILGLTLEMIVNDDLRAFAKLPTMFGAAAARKQSDIVYALLTSNPTMADGVALFHTSRGNIETAVANKTAPNVTNLSAARQALRLRKGQNGSRLNIRGKFVLVPVALSTSTEILLASATLTISGVSDQAKNPVGDLIPISDPRLDDVSSKEWYLLPDPAQVDTVEVAFLDGERMPVVTEHEEFRTDAMLFKARCVFGAGAMDDKMYKNPGE